MTARDSISTTGANVALHSSATGWARDMEEEVSSKVEQQRFWIWFSGQMKKRLSIKQRCEGQGIKKSRLLLLLFLKSRL